MKNLKVNSKFIVSFGAILILFLVSVVIASLGIRHFTRWILRLLTM